MGHRTTRLWALRRVALLLALLLLPRPAGAEPDGAPRLYLHRLAAGPAPAAERQLPAALLQDVESYAIIQFNRPIAPADQEQLRRLGLVLLEYIPDFAYLVRGSASQISAAAPLPHVQRVVPMALADKLSPILLDALRAQALTQPLRVALRSWPGEEQALAAALAARNLNPGQPFDAAQIIEAANIPALRWIEPMPELRLFNNTAREIMGVGAAWQDHGLYGAGQVVGIADSGLDTGNLATISPDFTGRIVATHVLSAGGDLEDEFGHGTHVAGSLAGAGVQSGANPSEHRYTGSFAGAAPEASLVIQTFEVNPEGQIIGGLTEDPYQIFAQAYADGARVHSNSWGGFTGTPFLEPDGMLGGYPLLSQRTDQFLWEHPDMAIFFAAGNSGNDGLYWVLLCIPIADGVIDTDSLNAPGTAKNVITVGASESERADAPRSNKVWNDVSSTCFSADPIASDRVSDNRNGLAAFSSRGPTDDERMKPDLVAPGTNILSNRSHVPGAHTLWDVYEANPHYTFSGGTSMAAPLAAGAGVLVREWLMRNGMANPSAAALKAVLLNTTADIAPGQYGAGEYLEVPLARPNGMAGWGRADLRFLSAPMPYHLWVDDHTAGLTTGQSVSYEHTTAQPLIVRGSTEPLRVMLTWTDPPASLSAAKQLVNDLDLKVTAPDGRVYWGNLSANGDRVNNVEGLVLSNPPIGAYKIEVVTHNIAVGSQPYALSVAGPIQPEAPAKSELVYLPLIRTAGDQATLARGAAEPQGRADTPR